MDKAEYKIATEHIKKLIAQGEYAEASHIADTIDWRRVKSVMMLCTISDLYKINRRYEDAKELLYMAYERNPESRTILYSLCDLSIKLEEFVAAIEYYKSFVEVAPRDTGRYVLQYRLYQAQDVSLEERIEVLEQLKREEYVEKWAYELAYLYHRIGFATKCVEECDELILWFGKGRYVYKAMELKMLHEPLTPSQQRIYDQRFEHMEQAKDMTRVLPRIDSGDSAMTDESMVDVTDAPTIEIPQDYIEKELEGKAEDIQVKTLDVANAYNTMNLQKELADSLREILDVSQTESATGEMQPDEPTDSYASTAEMEQLLAQKEDVVIEEVTPTAPESGEDAIVDDQITGQLTLDDIFASIEEDMKQDVTEEEVTEEVFEEIEGEDEVDSIAEEIDAALEAASDAYAQELAEETEEMPAEAPVEVPVKEEVSEVFEEEPEVKESEAKAEEEIREEPENHPDSKNFQLYEAFIRTKETEAQIEETLASVSMDPCIGNVAVTGHDLSICFEFIKVLLGDLRRKGFTLKGKTAKISAVNLNKKEPSEIINKIQGSVLIIERAGRLRKETVTKIQNCLQGEISSILIFLTDTEQGMNRFAERYPELAGLFNLRVDIRDYSGEELIEFATRYAYENEYSIETMGLLALRTRIEEMIANDDAPTIEDAKNIIDEAIEHVNRKSFKHFMDILLHKRYDEEDMIILREEDFF